MVQTQLNQQIDDRIDKKLNSIRDAFKSKPSGATVKKGIGDLRDELSGGLKDIRSDIEKTNTRIRGAKEDLARHSVLLQRQLKAAAGLPPQFWLDKSRMSISYTSWRYSVTFRFRTKPIICCA